MPRGKQVNLDMLIGELGTSIADLDVWVVDLTDEITADMDAHVGATIGLELPVDVAIAAQTERTTGLNLLVQPAGHLFSGLDLSVMDPWDYGDELSRLDALVGLTQDGATVNGVIKGLPRVFQWDGSQFGFAINIHLVPENRIAVLVGDARLYREMRAIHREGVDLDRTLVSFTRVIKAVERTEDESGVVTVSPPFDGYTAAVYPETMRPETFWDAPDSTELLDLKAFSIQEFTAILA